MEQRLYRPEEVAKMFGISTRMLGYMRRTGRIQGIEMGNITLYTDEQIKNADLSKRKPGAKSRNSDDDAEAEFNFAIA